MKKGNFFKIVDDCSGGRYFNVGYLSAFCGKLGM